MRFNPVLGFLAVATFVGGSRSPMEQRFNPVLGFLAVATLKQLLNDDDAVCFNPVLGFLAVATRPIQQRQFLMIVSIPCWVFWPSRRSMQPEGGE